MSIILHPLKIADQSKANQYMRATAQGGNTSLAHWAFPPHYVWKGVLEYYRSEVNGWWCLFAKHADGLFMPLPPQGPTLRVGTPTSGTLQDVLTQVMTFMDTTNSNTQTSRIENIPEELKDVIQPWGYSLTLSHSDYLYQTADLVQLKANVYKSQRAAYNRFSRAHRIRIVPYQMRDRDGCLALFYRWMHQKEDIAVPQVGAHADIARVKLQNAVSAHRVVLQEYRELGLTGRVVWVDGSIKAYAFGYPRSREVFCVLFEVADRGVLGLAQYLFREFCRDIQQYPFVNTMSDSGLPRVARTKHAYRPTQLVPNYIARRS